LACSQPKITMTRIVHLRSRLRSTCVRIAVVTLWLSSIVAGTAAADSWTAVANPPHTLGYHTATLLQDGRVLTVGVFGPPAIFDPRSGTWAMTVSPPAETVEIAQPTAVLLRDGRVLVAGGHINGGAYVNTAHLFDPRTNGWTPAASMTSVRVATASVLLADGRVLVSGGSNGSFPVASTEIYDPATNAWSPAAGMLQTRAGHAMVRLPDDRVLIVGPDTSEIYNPATNAVSTLRSLSTYRRNVAALLLPNVKVLAAGHNQPPGSATAEEYDPATDTWSLTGPLGTTVTGVSLSLLPDGRVLLDGAPLSGADPTSQLYDPVQRLWTNGPSSAARVQHSATLLADGRVLVAGGNVSSGPLTEIFDGRIPSTTAAASIVGDRAFAASVVLNDGRVLVAGGVTAGSGTELSTAAIYVPDTDTWQPIPSMSTARTNGHRAILLRDGRVMVIGGLVGGSVLAAPDLYDPGANSWQAGTPMNVARTEAGTVVLSNGWTVTVGGTGATPGEPIDSTEMYIPETNRWVPMTPMPAARRRLIAVRLADDRVLVAGGATTGSGTGQADAWVFDYRTNGWTPTTPMPAGRENPKGALLPDGRVIVVGDTGPGGVVPTTSFVWDPSTGLWTSVPFPGPARFGFELVTLVSGEVATVGGRLSGAGPTDIVTTFDGTTNAWTLAGTLMAPRFRSTAVVLPDGRLFRVGGYDATLQVSTSDAELVDLSRGAGSSPPTLSGPLAPLLNGDPLALAGLGFSGAFGAVSSGYATSSATNYPLVWYRSLTTGEQGFLPVDAWTDTTANTAVPGGRSLGPAAVAVRTSGVSSAPQLARFESAQSVTTLGPLPAVSYYSASQPIPMTATLSSFTPGAGRVLFYVRDSGGPILGWPTMSALVGADGTASISYTLPGGVPSGPYEVAAAYTGDPTHAPSRATTLLNIGPVSTTTTLTPASTTVPRGGSLQVTATVSAASGDPGIAGTIAVGNGGDSCTIAAPSGACDLEFAQLGPATIDAAYTATPPASYLSSTAQATVTVTCPDISIAPAAGTLPVAVLNQPYSVLFQATGGLAPYTFSLASGTLPPGLTLSGDTVSGTVTEATTATFTLQVTEAGGACGASQTYTLFAGARTYTLAEGASNGFFRSDISIANPNASDTPITLTYVSETGETATEARTLTPLSRQTIPTGAGSVAASIGSTFATRVTSETSLPLVVERATYFDGTLHAGDLSSASEGGSTTWTFAEGANGYFHTYLTLGNLEDQAADVTVRYLPEAGAPFDRRYVVAPHSRQTIDTRIEPALAAGAFAMTVTSTRPIAADRVQYFGSPFIGAHADSGARAPSADWYFAEGASGSAFDTYLLLGNPSTDAATVTVTWHTDAFETVTKAYTVPGEGRRSISVEVEDPRLATGSFWMEVHSTRPIVAERAMYLIRNGAWTDATDTTGAPAPALRWGLAEGIGGPPLGYVPYLLIANPSSSQAAEITMQYLLPTGAPLSHAYSVPALGRLTVDVRGETPALTGQQFGIVVSSTNGTPIVVERSLYWTLGTGGFVGAMNSMGTPLPPLP
jgi:hypothetical protein